MGSGFVLVGCLLSSSLAFVPLSAPRSRATVSPRALRVAVSPRAPRALLLASSATEATVCFIVPPSGASPFGSTSPQPFPEWREVAAHLGKRMPGFDQRLRSCVLLSDALPDGAPQGEADIFVALGVGDEAAPALATLLAESDAKAVLCHDCGQSVQALQRVGAYRSAPVGLDAAAQGLAASLAPWGKAAQGRRLSEQAALLFSRNSSEDMLYALFFVLHAYVLELAVVRHTINPT